MKSRSAWYMGILMATAAFGMHHAYATPGMLVPAEDIQLNTEPEQWECSYVLTEPCLVRVRAGVSMGPLLMTPTDWVVQDAGRHTARLDFGLKNGGPFPLDPSQLLISVLTCALPQNFSTDRDGADAFDRLAAMSRQPQRGAQPPERAAGLSPFWRAGLNREPGFSVEFPGSATLPSGTLLLEPQPRMRIKTADRVRSELRRPTAELTLYVDFKLLSEEDAPGTSEEQTLDLRNVSPGVHVLTLNLRDPGSNVGTCSYGFMVRPADEIRQMLPPEDNR